MRVFLAIFLGALLIFIGVQIFNLQRQTGDYDKKASELRAEVSTLSAENAQYQGDLRYYENNENLGKEALKYDRKKPGEQLYILVPQKTT